jgi:hypothetical protein
MVRQVFSPSLCTSVHMTPAAGGVCWHFFEHYLLAFCEARRAVHRVHSPRTLAEVFFGAFGIVSFRSKAAMFALRPLMLQERRHSGQSQVVAEPRHHLGHLRVRDVDKVESAEHELNLRISETPTSPDL